MKRFLSIGVCVAFAMGVAVASSDGGRDLQEECATTRDIQNVIVSLRDHGWTSQHIAESVLEVAKVQDEDTRRWFLGLIHQAYERDITAADIDADFQKCVSQGSPALSRMRM